MIQSHTNPEIKSYQHLTLTYPEIAGVSSMKWSHTHPEIELIQERWVNGSTECVFGVHDGQSGQL